MELLPQARGKGLHMFVQRRQRIDELTAEQEHEGLRSKSTLAEEAPEPEFVSSTKGRDVPINPQQKFQDYQNQPRIINQKNACINGLDSCQTSSPKPLVPNRTAKPFLGGINQSPRPYSPVRSPTASSKNIFKVAIPVNSSPQVWSPTGDVIASRDERIVVPAIKTGTLPEVKKRGQNKSDFRDPPEDDCFGLGAEACNFMQVPTVRQKHPPKVLPKPAINPACPPWSAEGRSPVPPAHPHPAAKPWTHTAPSSQSPFQPKLPWTKTHDGGSVVSCPPQRQSSYHYAPKTPLTCPRESVSELGSSDGITPKGKGAELFARRQSRMEKFVVDNETVQANRVRSPSPTLSMPSTWKYSSIIRAPAPVSYNPIVSPFYPHATQKQLPPVTGSKSKSQGDKEKPKWAPKHLSVMDVMKHQPYQLDSSLFTYGSNMDPKVPTGTKASSILALSTAGGQQGAKPGGPIYSRSRSVSLPRRHSSGSSPVFHPSPGPLDRPTFWAEEPQRGPLSLVTEGSCGHRWSLPEDKPSVYGPPFRPAQPLTVSHRYTGTGSLPRNFSPSHPHYRVSWRM